MYRIAFIGPESTAKSSLCSQLALHYKTEWVPEFSREYISKLNRPYTFDDVLHCIKMQLEEEKKVIQRNSKLIFTDNEVINGMVWLLDKYNAYPEWVESTINEAPYDLYLLTYPDIDFIADEVRENETRRMYFYEWYKRELEKRNFNYRIITGSGEERFRNTLKFVEDFLNDVK